MFEKIILVTRKTRYEELIERFNTRAQAKFYIEHAGGNFQEFQDEYDRYQEAFESVRSSIPSGLKLHLAERSLVPSLIITEKDFLITLGQDGVVANTAKYARAQPIIGVNPDVSRFDGILLPFLPKDVPSVVDDMMRGEYFKRSVTLAEVTLEDGQRLLAFNDFFLGASSHISARYKIHFNDASETQSSSGIIVSTGAGSTGWLSSIFNMAGGLVRAFGGEPPSSVRLAWDDRRLVFSVREPFRSKHSTDQVVAGIIEDGHELVVESLMAVGGVIFSDGVEKDYINFEAGARARVRAAASQAQLVLPGRRS